MRIFKPLPSLLLSVLLMSAAGCAQQTGTITKAAASYLVFVGGTKDAQITLDEQSFALNGSNAKNHFEISPGVHRIKVAQNGTVVVDREILLSDRQTMEIAIP
jgi:hypothetical protein